jgi:hypothetical protein
MTFRVKIYVDREIELENLAFQDWPDEAKELAYQVLANPRRARQFFDTPADMKKLWLISAVEHHAKTVEAIRQEFAEWKQL